MDYQQLASFVANDAALRRRQRLQPVGGAGEKIFPPTYPSDNRKAPPEHVFEARRIAEGEAAVWCVLVDSVQSQAAYSTPLRTPFRSDGGQHSIVMADSIPL